MSKLNPHQRKVFEEGYSLLTQINSSTPNIIQTKINMNQSQIKMNNPPLSLDNSIDQKIYLSPQNKKTRRQTMRIPFPIKHSQRTY